MIGNESGKQKLKSFIFTPKVERKIIKPKGLFPLNDMLFLNYAHDYPPGYPGKKIPLGRSFIVIVEVFCYYFAATSDQHHQMLKMDVYGAA